MPGMNGIDMLEVLKKQEPDLVSVIITAFADEQATIKALKIGANDYIRKPFSIRDLLAAIQRQITIIELRQNASRQQKFIDGMIANLVSGVLALDRENNIIAVNAKAWEALGLTEDVAESGNLNQLFKTENKNLTLINEIMTDLQESGARHLERSMRVIQSGLEIPYRISALSLEDSKGKNLGTVFLFNDISTVVQQEKLSAWKDLARTVAHEIKNPLTPIILGAQQLKSARTLNTETLLSQFDRAIDNIIRNAERLNHLAREFSRFGRLPDKKLAPVRLEPLVKNALETFSERFAQENITTSFLNDSPRDTIKGDADSLQRMLENLVGNACDAMSEGGKLEITLKQESDNWIKLTVTDTGEGIPEEILDSLFKPYVTSKEDGTGLGLVVVKEVVDRHDGRIKLESGKGTGSSFIIELPVLKKELPNQETSRETA
jgi:PAS domain S-box-containing protein